MSELGVEVVGFSVEGLTLPFPCIWDESLSLYALYCVFGLVRVVTCS